MLSSCLKKWNPNVTAHHQLFSQGSLCRFLSLISGIQKTLPVYLLSDNASLAPPTCVTDTHMHTQTRFLHPQFLPHPQSSCYEVNCADSAHWSSSDYCKAIAFWTLLFTIVYLHNLLKWRIFQNVVVGMDDSVLLQKHPDDRIDSLNKIIGQNVLLFYKYCLKYLYIVLCD